MRRTQTRTCSELVKCYRVAAGITQEELAERAQVSARTISDIERGGPHKPQRETIERLATALDLSRENRDTLMAATRQRLALPRSPSDAGQYHLPVPPTPLVGRDQEVEAACALLRSSQVQMLTLCGAGGVGKTRLALEIGGRLLDIFPDGVWFCDLAPLRDPNLVAHAIAHVLGLHEAGSQPLEQMLLSYLRGRQTLLLLDNFEHVVAAASLVADLLAACPPVKILVTSRASVHVRGEHEYPVLPLVLPDLANLPPVDALAWVPAIALFVERAQAVAPDFALTAANARTVAAICRRLDGLPLAIELAAARIKLFSPAALLPRLERRLEFLVDGARDLPVRQQTLRNTLAWSYDLLPTTARSLFCRLTVFAGGCALEAAEAVCAQAGQEFLDNVSLLVDHHLVRREDGAGGAPRISMLETLREYGSKQLTLNGEAEATQRAHAQYYLEFAEMAGPHLMRSEQVYWLTRLEEEHDNFRVALRWAVERKEVTIGLRLAGALGGLWFTRGHLSEGRGWLEKTLELIEREHECAAELTPARAKALSGAGVLAQRQGDYRRGTAFLEEALALFRALGNPAVVAIVLNNLGLAAREQGDYARAMARFEEAVRLGRDVGDAHHIAVLLNNLELVVHDQGDYRWAAALLEEVRAIEENPADPGCRAAFLYNRGNLAMGQGDYGGAVTLLEKSLAQFRDVGYPWGCAFALHDLGDVARCQGDYGRAAALLQESLGLFRRLGDTWGCGMPLATLGHVACARGNYRRAVVLLKESLELRRSVGDQRGMADSLMGLGHVARQQGNLTRAAQLYREGLVQHQQLGNRVGIAECLEGIAHLLCAQGRAEQAARLCAGASALRETLGAPLPPPERSVCRRTLEEACATLGATRFDAAMAEGRAMPLEQIVDVAVEASAGLAATGAP